jgi:hypothetical protein
MNLQELLDNVEAPADYSKSIRALARLGTLRHKYSHKVHFTPTPYDILAQCPKCKTVETLQFIGHTLTPSRKFRQIEGRVYHDCGSVQPCRLHK